jgi:hypothetical protein
MADLEAELISWANWLIPDGGPLETLSDVLQQKFAALLDRLLPSDASPDFVAASIADLAQAHPPLRPDDSPDPRTAALFLHLFYLFRLQRPLFDGLPLPLLSGAFERWRRSAPGGGLSLEAADSRLQALIADDDSRMTSAIADRESALAALRRQLADRNHRNLQIADAANRRLDLERAVAALEGRRRALERDRGAFFARQREALELRERRERLERQRRDLERLAGECGELEMRVRLAEPQMAEKREAEEARQRDFAAQIAALEKRLAGARAAAAEAGAAVRAAEQTAAAVDPDAVKGRWRKALDDEIMRLEGEIQDLQAVADLGSGLASDFGWR